MWCAEFRRPWGVLLAATLSTASAWGQTDASVETEFARAGQLRTAQQFDEALAAYRSLHDRTRSPRALAQMGITEGQMGRWVAADEHLGAALSTQDPWVERSRASLQIAFDRVRLRTAELTVVCNVPGAELRVDGTAAGSLPRSGAVRVATGAVVIDVLADGHEPYRQTVQLSTRSARVEVTLVPRAAVVTIPVAPTLAAVPRADTRPGAAVAAVTHGGRGPRRTLVWVSAAGAAVFLGVGAAGYAIGSSAADRWNDDAQCQRRGMTREQVCGGDRSTAGSMETLAAVGFVVGGALVATSAVLFLLSRSPGAEPVVPRATLACGAGPGELGVACRGTF